MDKKNYIQLSKINKTYDDGFVAVKDININITKGEFVTLLGPSGCGKTTILKMIAGFEQPSGGRIIVDGVDIKDLPVNQRPTATVFQDYALFPNMNVFENISYGLKVMRKTIHHVSNELKIRGEKIYREAIKKATIEIKKIKAQQIELLREIAKINSQYALHSEVLNIKDMRHLQYANKNAYFLSRLRRDYGDNSNFEISLSIRCKEFFQKINRLLFNQYRPPSYKKRHMNK
jgi:spermidine/putrescine transport system ATP-binding protein